MNTTTRWGIIESTDEGDFIGDTHVVAFDSEGGFIVTTPSVGVYLARWIDENGTAHEQSYKSKASAIKKAEESWGR